jgi:hypothetical protein
MNDVGLEPPNHYSRSNPGAQIAGTSRIQETGRDTRAARDRARTAVGEDKVGLHPTRVQVVRQGLAHPQRSARRRIVPVVD